MKTLAIIALAILASAAFAAPPSYHFRALQASPAQPGTVTTIAGIAGIDTHTHKAFDAAVVDIKAYTFTGVKLFGLRTLDLHLYPGVGQSGRVAGGGSLGKSFQLADQVSGFLSIGVVSMQGIVGFQPHAEGGLTIRW